MKAAELRDKTVEDLRGDLIRLREEEFRTRMQATAGQLGQTHLLKELSRDIARVKTVLNEKRNG